MLVRLRAHWNSRVRVPDLADTVGPVAERNCNGAIPPGGEQREANDQSVTPAAVKGSQSELDTVCGSGESSSQRRSPNEIELPAQREWDAVGGEPWMVGDGMVGSSGDVNQGTTAGGDERAGRGQSVRRSEEAGNDRGAKGRRKVVAGLDTGCSQKGSDSAARLIVRMHRRTGLKSGFGTCQWTAPERGSGWATTARLV